MRETKTTTVLKIGFFDNSTLTINSYVTVLFTIPLKLPLKWPPLAESDAGASAYSGLACTASATRHMTLVHMWYSLSWQTGAYLVIIIIIITNAGKQCARGRQQIVKHQRPKAKHRPLRRDLFLASQYYTGMQSVSPTQCAVWCSAVAAGLAWPALAWSWQTESYGNTNKIHSLAQNKQATSHSVSQSVTLCSLSHTPPRELLLVDRSVGGLTGWLGYIHSLLVGQVGR